MPQINVPGVTTGLGDLSSAASSLFAGLATPYQVAADNDQAAAAQTGAAADLLKGEGDTIEGQMYGDASSLADLNATYTAQSTAIQASQADRSLFMNLGTQSAAAAGAGGTGGGSAADIMRSSASQGALNRQVLTQQGLITEAGYQEQAQSYTSMQLASNVAAQAEDASAQGEQDVAAADQQAAQAAQEAGTSDFISAAIKGVAGIVSMFTPVPA